MNNVPLITMLVKNSRSFISQFQMLNIYRLKCLFANLIPDSPEWCHEQLHISAKKASSCQKKLYVLLCKHNIFPICMHFIVTLRNSEPVKTVAHKKLWWGCGGRHCIEYIKGTKPLHRVYQRYKGTKAQSTEYIKGTMKMEPLTKRPGGLRW